MHGKIKNNVPKDVMPRGDRLRSIVLSTMKQISDIVGATLGPGGCPVMLERQEYGLPPLLTKDGVTVINALGFDDSISDGVLELTRDASVRTANEAGDGTTTAAVLAEALVRKTFEYCASNPMVSPQSVVRSLMRIFRDVIEPTIQSVTIPVDPSADTGAASLRSVATVSANGDTELADVVLKCLELIGDEGNVTIVETSGKSEYRAQRIPGYPVMIGYEESAGRFYPEFLNDMANMRTLLQAPHFLIYHGQVTTTNTIMAAITTLGNAWNQKLMDQQAGVSIDPPCPLNSPNIVLVATGFSNQVLGDLAANFRRPDTMKVVPMLTPRNAMMHGQHDLILDLAAVTGATVFDPINRPLDQCTPDDVGPGLYQRDADGGLKPGAVEIYRFRANIVGQAMGEGYEDRLLRRISELQVQSTNPESRLDASLLRERLAKLTSGIAQLIVSGASNGELKERRDRAEDAVCAVTGAVKHGYLPGACWGLMHLFHVLEDVRGSDGILCQMILMPALEAPLNKLLINAGLNREQVDDIVSTMVKNQMDSESLYDVYDARQQRWVNAFEEGILDSTPAVLEAVRNAMSIALVVGTLGGAVMFRRDTVLERQDAHQALEFLRNANVNEADERP